MSIGATLLVYGVTELLHGYGFLAVFVAAVVIRRTELKHEYHEALHDFAETLERLASVVFLLLLGGSAVDGALVAVSPAVVVVALAIVLARVDARNGRRGRDDDGADRRVSRPGEGRPV